MHASHRAGYSLLELLFAMSVAGTLTVIALPQAMGAIDEYRARSAARYLVQQLALARAQAIERAIYIGLKFEPTAADYSFTFVADGNGNGIRTSELQRGIDQALAPADELSVHFAGVSFGLLPGFPDADGHPGTGTDGVRIGTSHLLSMNPNGSSSSGTLYLRGRDRQQYAVRVLGATGRIRVMRYEESANRWIDQ
jgi:prepilin-type N-terminal cleavage/methylation domain-containing protein